MITHIKDAKFKAIETKIDKLIALAIEKGGQSKDVSFTRDDNGIFQDDQSYAVTYSDINNIRVEIVTAIKDHAVMIGSSRDTYLTRRYSTSTPLASNSRELINKALTHLDLRQYQLAELLGVSNGQISKWKRNEYMAVSRQNMIKELL